jgi:formate-dependent nitrite reductase membrane component NrfD
MVAALALLVGVDLGSSGLVGAPALGVIGTALTGALLVWDLKRPERFLLLLLRPNPRSWLFRGGLVLMAFAGLASLWLLLGLLGEETAVAWLAAPAAAAGLMTAAYTGYLFGQAEGRDLWQSPLLFWHLIVQAVMVGAGALVPIALATGQEDEAQAFLARTLAVAAVAHLAVLAVEYTGAHPTRGGAAAAYLVTHGRHAPTFWAGGVAPVLVAAALAVLGWKGGADGAVLLGALLVHPALLAYESVFVRAGQDVPLS